MARFTCSCGKRFSAADKYAGRTIKCSACGATLTIPGAPQQTAGDPGNQRREDQIPINLSALPETYRPFVSGHRLAQSVMGLLAAIIVLHLVSAPFLLSYARALSEAMKGLPQPSEVAEAMKWAGRVGSLGEIGFYLAIAIGIVFWIWLDRVRRNLPALGVRNARYQPYWTAVGFLLPVWNLFRPFQVVREIWKASDPEVPSGSSWQESRTPVFLKWWWAAFLISGVFIAVYIAVKGTLKSAPVAWVTLASFPVASAAVSDVLTILLIWKIDQSQEAKVRGEVGRKPGIVSLLVGGERRRGRG